MTQSQGRRVVTNMLGCVLAALSIAPLDGCAGIRVIKAETQQIQLVMPPAPLGGQSTVDYTNVLHAGDRVNGYVNISGEWEAPADACSPWTFEARDPAGNLLDTATLTPNIVDDNPYYYFNFTVLFEGQYTIRLIHRSLMVRNLIMVISPPGWQYTKPPTSSG